MIVILSFNPLFAASIDKTTIDAIDVQAAASAAVDNKPVLSPTDASERNRLEKLLKNRSDAKELQEKNILKSK